MNLALVMDALAFGELSTLGCVEGGKIIASKRKPIISALNLGLISLHTRFLIKRRKETINLVSGKTRYALTSPDVLEVIKITDSDGNSYPGTGLFQKSSMNVLEASDDLPRGEYTIEYIAAPTPVTLPEGNHSYPFEDIEIDLPVVFLKALLYFIGSRMQSPVGIGLDSTRVTRKPAEANYAEKFEIECRMLEHRGVSLDDDVPTLNQFHSRGFV